MDNEVKITLIMFAVIALLVISGVVVCYGPAGIKTKFLSWNASAYGSDWLVVQYAQNGCVITSWELEDEAIRNEKDSDGIYFVTEEGPVVHLSGHYIYVQSPNEESSGRLLRTGYCE